MRSIIQGKDFFDFTCRSSGEICSPRWLWCLKIARKYLCEQLQNFFHEQIYFTSVLALRYIVTTMQRLPILRNVTYLENETSFPQNLVLNLYFEVWGIWKWQGSSHSRVLKTEITWNKNHLLFMLREFLARARHKNQPKWNTYAMQYLRLFSFCVSQFRVVILFCDMLY